MVRLRALTGRFRGWLRGGSAASWEMAEIGWVRFPPTFVARVDGSGRSEKIFADDGIDVRGDWRLSPVRNSHNLEVLSRLVQSLIEEGWEPFDHGRDWFSTRFRREVEAG